MLNIQNQDRKDILRMIRDNEISAKEGTRLLTSLLKEKNRPKSNIHYYEFIWHEKSVNAASEKENCLVVVFEDCTENSMIDENIVSKYGGRLLRVKSGTTFEEQAIGLYQLNYEQYDQYLMLAQLLKEAALPIKIINLQAMKTPYNSAPDAHDQDSGIISMFYLTKSLMELSVNVPVKLLFLNSFNNIVAVPWWSALSGFAKTVKLENPLFQYKTILLSDNTSLAVKEKKTKLLFAEFSSIQDDEVFYDENDKRYVKIAEPVLLGAEIVHKSVLRQNGIYLITGGAGGIGVIIADYIMKNYNGKVVLAGRSKLSSEKEQLFETMKRQGGDFIYIKADITVKEDTDRLITEAISKFGSLNGVIHSAGIIKDAFIINKTKQEFEAVLSPKVAGTNVLYHALKDQNLDFFALFSSNSSIKGNIGQCDYAYANAYLDCFAKTMKINGGNIVSINWPLWKNGGMKIEERIVQQMEALTGLCSMDDLEGIRAFENILASGKNHIAVVAGDTDSVRSFMEADILAPYGEVLPMVDNFDFDEDYFTVKIQDYLKGVISQVIKLPVHKIKPSDAFEKYGIDSLMVMDLTTIMERDFGVLSKTLFLEYKNLTDLAQYFVKNYKERLVSLFEHSLVKHQKTDIKQTIVSRMPAAVKRYNDLSISIQIEADNNEDEIAIIGLSGRFPMSDDIFEYWDNLKQGKDCITEIPNDRWDHSTFYSPERSTKNKTYTKWGGFINDADKFDPLFFNISPLETQIIDPQERIFLENTWHLFEDAGYAPSNLSGHKVGVFVGVMYGQYQLYGAEEMLKGNMIALGSTYASIPNRVSYFFDFTGPSMAVDSMCSSSLTTIHLACGSIRKGECEMAVAGGVNLTIHPAKYIMLGQGNFASSDGRCRSFGADGDGYVPGEGVGSVLLKPLKKAVEDGDQIYAIVKSSSINHGGKTNGYTVPNPAKQGDLIKETLNKANINPRTIGYIEAHGTGTSLGDPIEISGLKRAFESVSNDKQYCPIGSVKSNIGHLESAAGIAGITKVLLQMKYQTLVPSIHSETLNPFIDFAETPFYVQQQLSEWKQLKIMENGQLKQYPRRAGVSSFGAGGSNAHIILEEFPNNQTSGSAYDSIAKIIVLSAKDRERLVTSAKRLLKFIDRNQISDNFTNNSADLSKILSNCLTACVSSILNVSPNAVSNKENFESYSSDITFYARLSDLVEKEISISIEPGQLTSIGSIQALSHYLLHNYATELSGVLKKEMSDTDEKEYAPAIDLTDLAYTLQVGREAMEERMAFIAYSLNDVCDMLGKFCEGTYDSNIYTDNSKKTGENVLNVLEGEEGNTLIRQLSKKGKLSKLAMLWVSGMDINWQILYTSGKPKRISLPGYPFAKERHWFKPAQNPLPGPKAPVASYKTFNKVWGESVGTSSMQKMSGSILILSNHVTFGIAQTIFSSLKPVIVTEGTQYYQNAQGVLYMDLKKTSDGRNAAQAALKTEPAISVVIDLSDLADSPADRLEPGSKIALVQEIIKTTTAHSLCILHLTAGLVDNEDGNSTLNGAVFAGFIKILGAEYKKVTAKTIDVGIIPEDINEIRHIIETESQVEDNTAEVYYRHGTRLLPALLEVTPPDVRPITYHQAGVYIITGGMRGIGAEIAKHIVKKGVKTLVLMGITQLPPIEVWDEILNQHEPNKRQADLIRFIRSLEAQGTEVLIYTGKLTEQAKLSAFFDMVRARYGKIHGIFHCAGLSLGNNPAFIHKEAEDIEKVLEPKVQGLMTLHNVFKHDELTFFILFSSVSGLIPQLGAGLSDYAAANSFMDYFATYMHNKGYKYYLAVNWPNWKQGGMGEVKNPVYDGIGLKSISTEQGVQILDNVMVRHDQPVAIPLVIDQEKFIADTILSPKQNLEHRNTVAPETFPVKESASAVNQNTKQWLKKLFSDTLMIPLAKIDDDTVFGDYGVDSILVAELVKRIEDNLNDKFEPSAIIENPTINALSIYVDHYHVLHTKEAPIETYSHIQAPTAGRYQPVDAKTEIAVIGMACNFPGARDIGTFWNNLSNGVSSIREVPKSRWDINRYYSSQIQKGKSISKWGGFVDDIEYFDPEFFGISKEDALFVDPAIRLFLEMTEQVIRHSGYSKKELWGKKVGVYVGSRMGNYSNRIKNSTKTGIIGSAQNFISAYTSHIYNLKGPSIMVDTACSSSLVSIHLAMQSLIMGETDMAIAGGVDILLDEQSYLVLSKGQALSPDGKCHTFDKDANGFVPGEGCGAVMLKPLDKAIADGDQIYAVIESSAVNNDGHTMGATTPNPEAQSDVIRDALKRGDINARSISYLEAHGTGTMIGDPIELKALTRVFREYTDQNSFCGVGSVKSNFGHLLSAAGIASFIKVVLSLVHAKIPPTLNCKIPNPRFNFNESPFYPVTSVTDWQALKDVRRAGISSFGFGGTNAHMIVREFNDMLSSDYHCRRMPIETCEYNKRQFWLEVESVSSKSDDDSEKNPTTKKEDGLSILTLFDEL